MASRTEQAIIISAWPCVGKTYFTEHKAGEKHAPVDLDSSAYDLKSLAGTEKYVEDIEAKARGSPDFIILVSSHAEVRQLLKGKGLAYVAVSIDDLEDWKQRQIKRVGGDLGNNLAHRGLLKKGIAEWGAWKQREDVEEGPKIVLGKGQYLADSGVEDKIYKLWKAE